VVRLLHFDGNREMAILTVELVVSYEFTSRIPQTALPAEIAACTRSYDQPECTALLEHVDPGRSGGIPG